MSPTQSFLQEALQSLRAVKGICLGKPDAEKGLDMSVQGFVNSFFAFIFLLPVLALLCVSQWDIAHDPELREFLASGVVGEDVFAGSFSFFLWTRLGVSLIHFLLFPAVVYSLAPMMGRQERYFGFITGWNWAAVPASVLFLLPVLLLKATFVMPLLAFLLIACWLVALWILWRMIRVLLATEWLASIGVLLLWGALATVLDLLYSMLLA